MAFFSTEEIARRSARRPWTTVAVWAAILLTALGTGGALLAGAFTTDQILYTDTEATRGEQAIAGGFEAERLGAGLNPEAQNETVVIQSGQLTVDDPQFQSLVEKVAGEIRGLGPEAVAQVVTFYETGDPGLVSQDRRSTILPVLTGVADPLETAEGMIAILDRYDGVDGFEVVTGGQGSIDATFTEVSERDLQEGELRVGMPAAIVVLVLVFGALVAAGLPLVVGLLSVGIALGLSALIAQEWELSIFIQNVVLTFGLAVGIDYSLLVVQRFREERAKGASIDDAIARTGATANKAVVFSGLSVVAALSGLMIVPDNIFRSLGLGAILVTLVTIAAAITLLPAILHLLGDRVNRLHAGIPGGRRMGSRGGFWTRTSGLVMRHPILSIAVSLVLLGGAAVPYFTIETGQSGISSLPAASHPRRAFEALNEKFNAGVLQPAYIVVEADDVRAPGVTEAVEELQRRLADDPAFGAAEVTVNQAGTVLQVAVNVIGDAQSDEARAAIARIRDGYVPASFAGAGAEVNVTGMTAGVIDYADMIGRYTPWVFAWVLGLTFVILLVVFRSIVVPVKAIILNLLSVGAAYGLMVLVFQHGFAAGLLGFTTVPLIEAWIPLFLFAVLFGLSMDYHVFLLTRIRERYDETGDNKESVAFGVRTTAGMITGAAAIMVAVFSGFALGDLVMFQQMGFGLAVAVLLDATIIRTVLVPASMALLGNLNWYLPGWLGWLPEINVEGVRPQEPQRAAAEA